MDVELTRRCANMSGWFVPASAAIAVVVILVAVPQTAMMVATLTEQVNTPADAETRAWEIELDVSRHDVRVSTTHEVRAEDGAWVAEYRIKLDGKPDAVEGAASSVPGLEVVRFGSPFFGLAVFTVWAAVSCVVMCWRVGQGLTDGLLDIALFAGGAAAMLLLTLSPPTPAF